MSFPSVSTFTFAYIAIIAFLLVPRMTEPGRIRFLLSARRASTTSISLPDNTTPRALFDSLPIVVVAMFLLALKHLGFAPHLPAPSSAADAHTVALPHLRATSSFLITAEDRRVYRFVLGASPGHTPVQPTPLLLPPLVAPLMPLLLASARNPIRPLGSVNTRNVMRFSPGAAEVVVGETMGGVPSGDTGKEKSKGMSRVEGGRGSGWVAEAEMGGSADKMLGRRVRRGVEYDTVINIVRDSGDGQMLGHISSDVDSKTPIAPLFSMTFTALSTLPSARAPTTAPGPAAPAPTSPRPTFHIDPTPLRIASDAPSTYARLSRDYNPIHISSLLARAFGFRRGKIAHGNLVLTLVAQRALEGAGMLIESSPKEETANDDADSNATTHAKRIFASAVPDGHSGVGARGKDGASESAGSWIDVRFVRPVFVPCSLQLRWGVEDGQKSNVARVEVYEVVKGVDKVLVDIRAGLGPGPGE